MDYFKIFIILFILYVIYKFYKNDTVTENFTSPINLIDDWNGINQLGQIARNLMNSNSITHPGNLTITNNLKVNDVDIITEINNLKNSTVYKKLLKQI